MAVNGQRLKPESLAVTVGHKNISELTRISVKRLIAGISNDIELTNHQQLIGKQILRDQFVEESAF